MRKMDEIISALSELRSQYSCFDDAERRYYHAISEAIKAVKSAQPEILACGSGELVQESDGLVQVLVKDCISRQEVLDAIDKYVLGKPESCTVEVRELLKLITKIYRMSSAQPEIILCKDCKKMYTDEGYHDCWCAEIGKKVWLDHYCGYAERREE